MIILLYSSFNFITSVLILMNCDIHKFIFDSFNTKFQIRKKDLNLSKKILKIFNFALIINMFI